MYNSFCQTFLQFKIMVILLEIFTIFHNNYIELLINFNSLTNFQFKVHIIYIFVIISVNLYQLRLLLCYWNFSIIH